MNASAHADLLRALHVPGDPLIVTNVWDAASARAVAVRRRGAGARDREPLDLRGTGRAGRRGSHASIRLWMPRRVIVRAVDIPVSVDFERGYAPDAAGVEANVRRLAEAGAAGLNFEDSLDGVDHAAAGRAGGAGRRGPRRGGGVGGAAGHQRARRCAPAWRDVRAGGGARQRLPGRRRRRRLRARPRHRGTRRAGRRRDRRPGLGHRQGRVPSPRAAGRPRRRAGQLRPRAAGAHAAPPDGRGRGGHGRAATIPPS